MPEFVTSDDVRLSFLDDGEGPPVVLVAGFRAPATSWVFQRRHLVEQGYRVLALDRRGHGASDTPAWRARMALAFAGPEGDDAGPRPPGSNGRVCCGPGTTSAARGGTC